MEKETELPYLHVLQLINEISNRKIKYKVKNMEQIYIKARAKVNLTLEILEKSN